MASEPCHPSGGADLHPFPLLEREKRWTPAGARLPPLGGIVTTLKCREMVNLPTEVNLIYHNHQSKVKYKHI